MTFDEIPVIDIGPLRNVETPPVDEARAFTDICHRVGFAVVTNHDVSSVLHDTVFAMMHDLFALPEADKRRIDKQTSPQFRGWEPIGAETTDNRPDIREQVDVWTEWPVAGPDAPLHHRLHGPNQWLPEDVISHHRATSLTWIERLSEVASDLMRALAVGLDLDPDHFDRLFGEQPMSLAKFIHYPPTPADAAGVNPHHDAGFLTVLAPGPTPGLQVQNPEGEWIDVPIIERSLVINLGEVLQAMTGNYLVATPHRVVTADERWSAGYFHGPSLDTRLDPLPLGDHHRAAVAASARHQSAGFMPTKAEADAGLATMTSTTTPATYGEQLWNYFTRSYPEQMARHHSAAISARA